MTDTIANAAGTRPAVPTSPQTFFRSPLGRIESRTLSAEGVQFEYFEFGNPRGTPLVLAHGFPDSPLAWEGVVAHLDLSQVRVIAPFLRGCGGSTVPREELFSAQEAALWHDPLALLAAFQIPEFHLVGHDWGAKASYTASLLAPERVLSLCTLASRYVSWRGGLLPPAQVHSYWYQFYFQLEAAHTRLQEHRDEFCKELWKIWSPTYRFSDETFSEAAKAWNNPQFVPLVLDYYRIHWSNVSGKPAYSESQAILDVKPTPKIEVPTTFIQGSSDGCDLWQGADGQENYFPAFYERVLLPDVGHFPHRENAQAVARAISSQMRQTEH